VWWDKCVKIPLDSHAARHRYTNWLLMLQTYTHVSKFASILRYTLVAY